MDLTRFSVGVVGAGDNIELQENACTDRSLNISGWVTVHQECNGVKLYNFFLTNKQITLSMPQSTQVPVFSLLFTLLVYI